MKTLLFNLNPWMLNTALVSSCLVLFYLMSRKIILDKITPWLLLFFGILGFLLIFKNDYFQFLKIPVWLLPTATVVFYAGLIYVYVMNSRSLDLAEHYTESVYFLGFLFTLIALFSLSSYETDVRISSKPQLLTSTTPIYTNTNYTLIVLIFSCSPIQNAMTVGGCKDILLYGMTSKGPHHWWHHKPTSTTLTNGDEPPVRDRAWDMASYICIRTQEFRFISEIKFSLA